MKNISVLYLRTKITLLAVSGCFYVSTQLPGLKYIIQMNCRYEFVVLVSLRLPSYVTFLSDVIDSFCYLPWWACHVSRPCIGGYCACLGGYFVVLLLVDHLFITRF